jgi:hypothetical protein
MVLLKIKFIVNQQLLAVWVLDFIGFLGDVQI